MSRLTVCWIVLLIGSGVACSQEVLFQDDFADGVMDGWHHLSTLDAGYAFWVQGGELWGKASSGANCSACSGCNGIAIIDDVVARDVTFECKLTNRNSCGLIHVRLRLSDDDFSSDDGVHFWHVTFDPGVSFYSLGAKVGSTYHEGTVTGTFSYGIDVPRYIRLVLVDQTIELWISADGEEYQFVDSSTCPDGYSQPGYVAVKVGSSAKHASFDDVSVLRLGASPVAPASWGTIKAMYQ